MVNINIWPINDMTIKSAYWHRHLSFIHLDGLGNIEQKSNQGGSKKGSRSFMVSCQPETPKIHGLRLR